MARKVKARRRLSSTIVVLACFALSAGAAYSIFGKSHNKQAVTAGVVGEDNTASISKSATPLGQSGLPLPRFVSLKTEKVNVRKGPSSDHPVSWVFQSKGLPVEIIAEFETWRRVRDSEGAEGWILQNMLAGKRTVTIAPWRKDQITGLHSSGVADSGLVANITSGAMGEIKSCDGNWCQIMVGGYKGYVEQSMLWGAYPGEVVN
jgi:SH3-like domain-containing protein